MVVSIVVDNSAIVPLFLPDESSDYAQKILRLSASLPFMSSTFMLIEFGNALLSALRRGRLTPAQATFAHGQVPLLGLEFVNNMAVKSMPAIHDLAFRRQLSFYDAVYLHLAMDKGAALATQNSALREAAIAEGVEVAD